MLRIPTHVIMLDKMELTSPSLHLLIQNNEA